MTQDQNRSQEPDRPPAHQRKGSLLRTVRAVAWSMIGLRKGAEYQKDIDKLNPIHIIVVGLLGLFLLVIGLIALVNWIV
ncbi:DUF2970 domain-containing protein [Diaphorobacter caeni]|uniref:DUF2970 domain-containing protein n=1 Tax=Diaphorobacter caeni TaxID=2784387 RepID=UPI00188F7F5E|nr:DUF2970 domain-containing protein [Diaphorobacter caeni]MBF5003023.1 DUF2970 domain-containing protein [Diaphorobacter caeni]